MRSALAALTSAVLLLSATISFAQIKRNSDHIVARLSYSNTLVKNLNGPRRVCLAIYQSRLYRLWRPDSTNLEPGDPDPNRVISQGALTDNQMRELGSMLNQLNFKSQGGGILERGAESFLAELVRNGKSTRYRWLDPDHRRPFPDSVNKIVGWMQNFQPHDSARITLHSLSDIQVCPSANENPLPLFAFGSTTPGKHSK